MSEYKHLEYENEFGDTFFSMPRALGHLQALTPPELVQKKKTFGKGPDLDYVSAATVIRTLNKAFGFRWSFRIHETRVVKSEDFKNKEQGPIVQTLGELTVPGLGTRMQWGSQAVIGGQGPQEHTFKGSSSDALKKCAAMFLVHLDLADRGPKASTGIMPEDIRPRDLMGFEKDVQKPVVSNRPEVEQPDEPTPDVSELEIEEAVEQEEAIAKQEVVEVPKAVQESIEALPDQPGPMGQTQQTIPASQQLNVEPPAPAPETQAPAVTASTHWAKEDIDGLKAHKDRLGVKTNEELGPYVQEFFGVADATFHQIQPTNIKDFNHFLETKSK